MVSDMFLKDIIRHPNFGKGEVIAIFATDLGVKFSSGKIRRVHPVSLKPYIKA